MGDLTVKAKLFLACIALFGASSFGAANATTFNVAATFSTPSTLALSGTLDVNNGIVSSIHLLVAGDPRPTAPSPSFIQSVFLGQPVQGPSGLSGWEIQSFSTDVPSNVLDLVFSTPNSPGSLLNFNGGSILSGSFLFRDQICIGSNCGITDF